MLPRPDTRPKLSLWLLAMLTISVVAAACGGSAGSDESGLTVEPVGEDTESDEEPPSTNGEPAPELVFTYFDGSDGTLDDYAGKPTVLNFWASWCAPCVAEMPDLEEVFQEVGGEVAFVGFNVTDDRTDADNLIVQTGVTYTMAEDPDGAIHRAFRGFAMPTTILIAADGTVVRSRAGAISGDQLRGFISEDFGV
jgi:cytochrome c biogenesis protein CcmG/thiol:disulfide interchange protein DsbE